MVTGCVGVAGAPGDGMLIAVGVGMIAVGVAYKLSVFTRRCLFLEGEGEDGQTSENVTTSTVLMAGGYPGLLVHPTSGAPTCLMILLHGKGCTVHDCEAFAQLHANSVQCAVLLPEYPGYPLYRMHHRYSTPSTGGVETVSAAAYDHARTELGYTADKIVVCGHSIGTGGASWLAAQRNVAALVLVSPYATLTSVIGRVVSTYTCSCAGALGSCLVYPCASWRPKHILTRTTCPILILHGALDPLITLDQTREILSAIVESHHDLSGIEFDKTCSFGRVAVRVSSRSGHQFEAADDIIVPIVVHVRRVLGLPVDEVEVARALGPAEATLDMSDAGGTPSSPPQKPPGSV